MTIKQLRMLTAGGLTFASIALLINLSRPVLDPYEGSWVIESIIPAIIAVCVSALVKDLLMLIVLSLSAAAIAVFLVFVDHLAFATLVLSIGIGALAALVVNSVMADEPPHAPSS